MLSVLVAVFHVYFSWMQLGSYPDMQEDITILVLYINRKKSFKAVISRLFLQPVEIAVSEHNTRPAWIAEQIVEVQVVYHVYLLSWYNFHSMNSTRTKEIVLIHSFISVTSTLSFFFFIIVKPLPIKEQMFHIKGCQWLEGQPFAGGVLMCNIYEVLFHQRLATLVTNDKSNVGIITSTF